MNLHELLGKKLKDDAVLEVLNDYQIEGVVYDFDRLHENMEDIYWATAKMAGFQLRFDQWQTLDTVFCYIAADEGFVPISPDIIGAPVYKTFDAAETACKSLGLKYATSIAEKWWLRIESAETWSHYQFQEGIISRVTLSLPKA